MVSAPPTRRSPLISGRAGNHLASSSASVTARQTRSGGCASRRSKRTPTFPPSASISLPSCASLIGSSLLVQMSFKRVETLGPEPAIRLEPLRDLGERLRLDLVDPPLRLGAHRDQAGVAQDSQVLGDAGLAHLQPLDQIADRPLAVQQQVEDAPSGRFCQYLEDSRGSHMTSITT